MSLLYSDGKSVIDREIDVENRTKVSKDELLDAFELERCVSWITEHELSRICLQFPDDLLEYSVDIAQHLEQKTFKQIYILGDTSYGSCCVDEVAASHVNADGIIHFGHSCLSTVNRLLVLYIFEKKALDKEKFLDSLSSLDRQKQVIVFYDTCYAHHFDDTMSLTLEQLCITMSQLNTSSKLKKTEHTVYKLGRHYSLKQDDAHPVINVYVCDSRPCRNLDNFVMSMAGSTFFQFNPDSNSLSPVTVSSCLKRHLYLAEKVKDAQRVGILVATLSAGEYLKAVSHVKNLCRAHGKRSYIISVGKPNVPKLANFPEIDLYVLISCCEMTLPDAKDFLQPVVHLIDVELALNPAREWENRVNLDFTQLMEGGTEYIPCPDVVSPNMDISLLSNSVRMNGVQRNILSEVEDCATLALKHPSAVSVITGREGLTGKSWQGLEPNLGLTPVSTVIQGRTGTPSGGYTSADSEEKS